jgi:hypothetical protein
MLTRNAQTADLGVAGTEMTRGTTDNAAYRSVFSFRLSTPFLGEDGPRSLVVRALSTAIRSSTARLRAYPDYRQTLARFSGVIPRR